MKKILERREQPPLLSYNVNVKAICTLTAIISCYYPSAPHFWKMSSAKAVKGTVVFINALPNNEKIKKQLCKHY